MEEIAIDLSIADNYAVQKAVHTVDSTPFIDPKPGLKSFGCNTRVLEREDGAELYGGSPQKRRRSISPTGSLKRVVHPPQF